MNISYSRLKEYEFGGYVVNQNILKVFECNWSLHNFNIKHTHVGLENMHLVHYIQVSGHCYVFTLFHLR